MVYLVKQQSPHYPENDKRMFQHLNSSLCRGMAIVHMVKGEKKTLGEIASLVSLKAVHEASNSIRLDIVFDVYKENSIKNTEQY